jgi:hypothetical protein
VRSKQSRNSVGKQVGQKARHQPLQLGRQAKICCCNQHKSSPLSTQEGSYLVHLALGDHGGGFKDSNSREVMRARERSGLKSRQQLPKLGWQTKTWCCNWWKGLSAIYKRRSPSSLCSPWWSHGGCLRVLNSNLQVIQNRNCVLPLSVNFWFSTDLCTILRTPYAVSTYSTDTLQYRAKPRTWGGLVTIHSVLQRRRFRTCTWLMESKLYFEFSINNMQNINHRPEIIKEYDTGNCFKLPKGLNMLFFKLGKMWLQLCFKCWSIIFV